MLELLWIEEQDFQYFKHRGFALLPASSVSKSKWRKHSAVLFLGPRLLLHVIQSANDLAWPRNRYSILWTPESRC